MNAYHFEPETGRYTGILPADPDPFQEGAFILPGNSTFTEPPEEKPGFLRIWNGSAWEYAEDHTRDDFNAACAQFRTVCASIASATGNPDFRGGFDEMTAFSQTPVYQTFEGLQLAMAWSAANELCVYEAKKIGIGQPQWWYVCWEMEV